jgi:hypothetical protein
MIGPLFSAPTQGHHPYQIPPVGMGHRLPWKKNWPHARPQCHGSECPDFSTISRQRARRAAMKIAIDEVAKRFGGESRRTRRAMGIALSKRLFCGEGRTA